MLVSTNIILSVDELIPIVSFDHYSEEYKYSKVQGSQNYEMIIENRMPMNKHGNFASTRQMIESAKQISFFGRKYWLSLCIDCSQNGANCLINARTMQFIYLRLCMNDFHIHRELFDWILLSLSPFMFTQRDGPSSGESSADTLVYSIAWNAIESEAAVCIRMSCVHTKAIEQLKQLCRSCDLRF